MASDKEKDAAAVRVFPPGVPLVTLALGFVLERLWPIDPGIALPGVVRYGIGGLIVAGAIFGIGLWAVITMRRSGQSPNPWEPTTEILERGPYRFTRNPMYLQMVIGCLGFAVMFLNVWILLLTPVCAWVLQRFAILPEEAYLTRKFGEPYRAYRQRVRRWI